MGEMSQAGGGTGGGGSSSLSSTMQSVFPGFQPGEDLWGWELAQMEGFGGGGGGQSTAAPSMPDVGVDSPGTINAMELGSTGTSPFMGYPAQGYGGGGVTGSSPGGTTSGSTITPFSPTPAQTALAQNGVAATPFGFGTPNPFNMMSPSYMGPPVNSYGWPQLSTSTGGTAMTPAAWQNAELSGMENQLNTFPGAGSQSQTGFVGATGQPSSNQANNPFSVFGL